MTNTKGAFQATAQIQSSQPDKKSVTTDECAKEVSYANLTIRVQKNQRLHWLIEAKKQGTSLTAAIVEALNARFGSPP